MSDEIIRNENHFNSVMKSRRENALFKRDKDNKMVIDHAAVTSVMIKIIMIIPMDKWIKKVMIMRMGNPMKKEKPLSAMQIALHLGIMESEVIEMEQYGLACVDHWMKKCSEQDSINKFNADSSATNKVKEIQDNVVNPDNQAA